MTHAQKKSFRDFENTEHAVYGAKHHHGAQSVRGDTGKQWRVKRAQRPS